MFYINELRYLWEGCLSFDLQYGDFNDGMGHDATLDFSRAL